ncbi:MAG: exo-alpha-sialidase [Magnetococcales bacterium]|nr:exo-alpha-sialidase [Magnetococcales bacterium]
MGGIDYGLSPWQEEQIVGVTSPCLCGGCSIAITSTGDMHSVRAITDGEVRYARSLDGGATWTDGQLVENGVRWWNHSVHIIGDSSDRLYVFFVDADDTLRVKKSTDNGDSWTPHTIGSPSGKTLGRRLWAVADGSDLLHVAIRDDEGTVWHSKSLDLGVSWATWKQVSGPIVHLDWATNIQIAVDGAGNLHLVAEAIVSDARTTFWAMSRDIGATWTEWSQGWHAGAACAATIAAKWTNKVCIVYVEGNDIRSARSSNGGTAWTHETVITGTADFIFDLWSPPGLIALADGGWHAFVYVGGAVHKILNFYKTAFDAPWTMGEYVIVGAEWKTPADITAASRGANTVVQASVGVSPTHGVVKITAGTGARGTSGGDSAHGDTATILATATRTKRVDPDQVASGVGDHLYLMDCGTRANGNDLSISLERTGIVLEEGSIVQVSEVWPEMIGDSPLDVQVGSHSSPEGEITWNTAQTFDPIMNEKVDVRVTGRFIAIRFIGANASTWELAGFALKYEVRGRY